MVALSDITYLDMTVVVMMIVGLVTAAALHMGWLGGDPKGKQKNWWESKSVEGIGVPKPKTPVATSTPGVSVAKKPAQGGSAKASPERSAAAGTGDGRTPWERSKAKSELGYYQAHHSKLPDDGIASHEFEMNRPKPLGTRIVTARPPTKITSYTYEDTFHEVRLDFRQEGWDWSQVPAQELSADWNGRSARLTINSTKYGAHVAAFTDLYGELAGVAVRKMKRSVRFVLMKKAPGAWPALQGSPLPPVLPPAADDAVDASVAHELAVD
ncbi:hypothetical protein JKP88DRAFT_215240 [Tribonema minus]|uniref:Uncharacterized protein n=1 Tax=Tribonema minus TaxID=303371 RepID=A0A835Z330_9STRA|nr:hypothetical protein JKP88DRAFT_215240 [Tribonema minus]